MSFFFFMKYCFSMCQEKTIQKQWFKSGWLQMYLLKFCEKSKRCIKIFRKASFGLRCQLALYVKCGVFMKLKLD